MYQIKINFVDFIELMEKEIIYHGRRFYGRSEDEKDGSKKWWLKKYYKSLSYVSSKHLGIAFDKCRENHDKFPTVNQLLKFCPPKQLPKAQEVDYSKPVPIPPEIQARINYIGGGPSKTKIGEEMMQSMKNMCRLKFGSHWKETFERWDQENEARLLHGIKPGN